jgi:hypothetical protein
MRPRVDVVERVLTDGGLSLGDGVAGADGLVDDKLGTVPREPGPARAECGVAGSLKLSLELVVGAKVLFSGFRV